MRSKLIATLLALAGLLLLAACGSDDGDESSTRATTPASSTGNGVDRAFAQTMIPHHESAVTMARIALRRGESRFVRALAADIAETQDAEIATLRARDRALAARGVDVGALGVPDDELGMDHDAGRLADAARFDRAFLEAMIPHHRGAIAMARAEIAGGGDDELIGLAERIAATQQGEIDAMRSRLRAAGDDAGSGESQDPGAGGHEGGH